MSDQTLKIAVFIDFDNVEIGVKTTLGLHFDVGAVLEAVKERGEIITKIAYGDWKRAEYARTMASHAVRLVQRVTTPGGDKNGADINLALDALEMAFTHDHINAFVIVGGDSDFITLVEKLKQYDKKVFVVGGRNFTSQVMQKNCTEFIAYENIAKGARSAERARIGTATGAAPLDQALPLIRRAMKVLLDREVTPQLGLLKSTLLQLDSSFSERDYGASTFRDFAEKLAKRGLVELKHTGRSTLVELSEAVAAGDGAAPEAAADGEAARVEAPRAEAPRAEAHRAEASRGEAARGEGPRGDGRRDREPADPQALAEGVALVRRTLANPPNPPRWPMYLRQMKQLLRQAVADFDERKYGSIVELMRACQRDGLLRVERDRQGGLRVFSTGAVQPGVDGGQPVAIPDDLPDDIGNRLKPGEQPAEPPARGKGRRVHKPLLPEFPEDGVDEGDIVDTATAEPMDVPAAEPETAPDVSATDAAEEPAAKPKRTRKTAAKKTAKTAKTAKAAKTTRKAKSV